MLANLTTSTPNLMDLAEVLADPEFGAFDRDRVHVFDQLEYSFLPRIHELATGTSDTLLINYTGHGLNEIDDLYLAYSTTVPSKTRLTALAYDQGRHLVLSSGTAKSIVILDCCYAGKAIGWMADQTTVPGGELDIRGTYLLTATANSQKALAPIGERIRRSPRPCFDYSGMGSITAPSTSSWTNFSSIRIRIFVVVGCPPRASVKTTRFPAWW
jgi:ATP-dependent Clp protease ATP-binding subunit ClpC